MSNPSSNSSNLGPWRTIILAMFAIMAIMAVVFMERPEGVTLKAIDTIAYIAGGGAVYRYFADRNKTGKDA